MKDAGNRLQYLPALATCSVALRLVLDGHQESLFLPQERLTPGGWARVE
jgi:hypothetical protein